MIQKYKNYYATWREQQLHNDNGERGDVPGWVLITLMTAGLVVAIWTVAGPALTQVFNTAIEKVASF